MGARRWGSARGASGHCSTARVHAAARSFVFRDLAPAVLLIIGLLLLTGALLGAAPAAHAAPLYDTRTWDGGAGDEYPEWSNELNWVGDTVPGNGDSLVFPAGSGCNANNNDCLDDVGAISVGDEMFVDGSALGLGDDLTLGRDSVWAVAKTTLEDDVSVVSTVTPEPTPESTPYAHLGQDIEMVSPTTGAHALTVENLSGFIVHHGSLTGADAACGLTKKGPGTFVVGGPGGKGHPWGGVNTWAGPTDVQAGTLGIDAPGALSSHTGVHIEGGAHVAASFPEPAATDVWSNEFTGSGRIDVESAALTMTAASGSFVGTVGIDAGSTLTTTGSWPADTVVGGLLRGSGTVGLLTLESGSAVSPAVDDYESNTLDGGGMALLKGGSSYVCDVTDVDEAAGLGHDLLALQGDATFSDTSTDAANVVLRSGAGGVEGPAPGFDKMKPYAWTILTTPAQINGFDADAVKLDTTAFEAQNPVGEGTFALEVVDHTTSQSLDVVFTPLADFETGPAVGDGGDSFAKGSTQTVAWEMDATPPAGSVFKVVADDPGSEINVLLATVPATSVTEYSYHWTIDRGPSEGWHVTVELWSASDNAAVQYRAKDSQTFDIKATGRPTTTVRGVTSRWVNHPVTMTFTGHPGGSGSPIAFTEYAIGDASWVQGATCTVGVEGVTTVQYRSQDQDGVLEDPAKRATVRIDTRRPKVKAKALTAGGARIVRLRYRVGDPLPSSGTALVRLVVRDRSGKVMTRSSSVPAPVNKWLRIRVSTCAIHVPGVYTVCLRARDLAGNLQNGWTKVRMTVR